jgi:alanine-synthesizing transaminase
MANPGSPRRFARIDRLPLRLQHHCRAQDGRPPPWRRHHRPEHGQPDGATPPHIVEKLVTGRPARHPRLLHVAASAPAPGHLRWYKDRYEVDIDPESEAIVTIGSKEGLAHLMLATLDQGDTVLVPNPSYPIHIYGAVIAGAQVRSVPLVPGWTSSPSWSGRSASRSQAEDDDPRLPVQPDRAVRGAGFLRARGLAKQYDVLVVHDLAYADIVYDGWKAPSIMQVPGAKDIAVEFFTLSKSYNMAGWRIGFMVGNPELVSALARIKSYHDYGTFTRCRWRPSPLEGDQQCVRDIAEQYRQRRNLLVKGLHELGWMVENPKASMYVWAKIPSSMRTWVRWSSPRSCWPRPRSACRRASAFGDYGDDHVRFALIENQDRIRQAIRGIRQMFRADGLARK